MEGCIKTIDLFPILNRKLIDLLGSLSEEDFHRSTQFPSWKVKDICAHLLDTSIRRLSGERDHYQSLEHSVSSSYEDLVNCVTNLADRWALAFAGVSPQILIELIEHYQNKLYEYLKTLDPNTQSYFPVSWAGENSSYNWFDIAREYTERWHHQMQIREALGKEPLYEDELYYPVLDTFMRALPYHYRNWEMDPGYTLRVEINGKPKWKWYLEWGNGIEQKNEVGKEANTTIMLDQDKAWKILTRWNNRSVYAARIAGNKELGEYILEMNCLLIKN